MSIDQESTVEAMLRDLLYGLQPFTNRGKGPSRKLGASWKVKALTMVNESRYRRSHHRRPSLRHTGARRPRS